MRAALVLLAFVSSALAYQVNSPNAGEGWTNKGPQTLTWSRVTSDSSTFSVTIENDGIGLKDEVLATHVNGLTGKVKIDPPSGGWIARDGYRLNMVHDGEITRYHAQSTQFEIRDVEDGKSTH